MSLEGREGWVGLSVSVSDCDGLGKKGSVLSHTSTRNVLCMYVYGVLHGRLGSQPCAHLSYNLAYRIRRKERGFGEGGSGTFEEPKFDHPPN